jgi:hypothetical protein
VPDQVQLLPGLAQLRRKYRLLCWWNAGDYHSNKVLRKPPGQFRCRISTKVSAKLSPISCHSWVRQAAAMVFDQSTWYYCKMQGRIFYGLKACAEHGQDSSKDIVASLLKQLTLVWLYCLRFVILAGRNNPVSSTKTYDHSSVRVEDLVQRGKFPHRVLGLSRITLSP